LAVFATFVFGVGPPHPMSKVVNARRVIKNIDLNRIINLDIA